MVKRFVSLLSAEAGNYEKIIKKIEAQNYNELHFDIMDGHFVKNFAFGPGLIKSLRKITKLPFQAHLEIKVDTEDHVTIMFKFEDNIKGVLIAAQVCPGRKQFIEWEINGSEKSLNWNGEEPNSLWIGHRSAITLKSPSFLLLKKVIEFKF